MPKMPPPPPPPPPYTAPIQKKKDIQTSLSYHKQAPPKDLCFDVSLPSGEKSLQAWSKISKSLYPFTVHDIRGQENEYTLEKDHIQFVHQGLPPDLEGKSDNEIIDILCPLAEQIVKKLTGATETYVSKFRIRKFSGKFNYDARQLQALHAVHTDRSALGVLHQFAHRRPDLMDPESHQLKRGRLYLLNIWHPFKTVTKDPLAWVDMDTVEEGDVCHLRMEYQEHWIGIGNVVHNPKHEWKYLSGQRKEEVMVFKQFDSAHMEGHAGVMPHSAIVDEDYEDEPPRESVEFGILAWRED